MLRTTAGLAAAFLVVVFVGCDATPPNTPPAKPADPSAIPAPAPPKGDAPAPKADAAPVKPIDKSTVTLNERQITKIKGLKSEDDQKLALEQKVCPITAKALGSMGTPMKLDLNGKPVFICCEGCEDGAKANPGAALAKLGMAK